MALAVDPVRDHLMRRPPRDPQKRSPTPAGSWPSSGQEP
ncbi:hypothetical protein [Streptomyces olivaceoviridis]